MSATAVLPGLSPVSPAVLAQFSDAWRQYQRAKLALWHAAAQAWFEAAAADRDFVADELAVLMNCHPATGSALLAEVDQTFELGVLLAEWSAGNLSDRHVHAAVAQLHASLTDTASRRLVLDVVLDRCRRRAAAGHGWPTPGRLRQLIRVAALLHDPAGAQRRKEQAEADRGAQASALPHGQAMLALDGPEQRILVMAAALRARAERAARQPGETRTLAQLEFDLADELLTGEASPYRPDGIDGPDPAAGGEVRVHVEAQVVMSLDTATGTSTDPGELPGLGPVLPSTCQALLHRADTLRRICTDPTGRVIAVDPPIPIHRDPEAIAAALEAMRSAPVMAAPAGERSYRPSTKTLRFVRTRDRTCRFPGCSRPAQRSDVDHRLPWPLGPTSPENLHVLCRHHHRAKQSGLFTVTVEADGSTVWTLTRTGQTVRRPPPTILPSL